MGNIRDILEELGYQIIENPKEFRTTPIYRESKNKTVLSIRKDSGRWIDYGLGATGDLTDLVQLTLKLKDVNEAQQWLKTKNINITTITRVPRQKISIPEIFDKECLMRLSQDYSYWEGRGVLETTLKRFGGGIAYKGKMAGRYIFPIYNHRDDLVGFAGRDIFNNAERVKWKLLGTKDKWVYPAFLNSEVIKNTRSVVLVESIGDILSLFQAGVENVLVTFGISLSSGILNFLIRTDVQKIIVSLNNDSVNGGACGNEASKKIKHRLLSYFDESQVEINLPPKKDFGEMTVEEILSWKQKITA